MFYSCNMITELNLNSFEAKKNKNMSYLFAGWNSLKVIIIAWFDTNNVIDLSGIFMDCTSLKNLNYQISKQIKLWICLICLKIAIH